MNRMEPRSAWRLAVPAAVAGLLLVAACASRPSLPYWETHANAQACFITLEAQVAEDGTLADGFMPGNPTGSMLLDVIVAVAHPGIGRIYAQVAGTDETFMMFGLRPLGFAGGAPEVSEVALLNASRRLTLLEYSASDLADRKLYFLTGAEVSEIWQETTADGGWSLAISRPDHAELIVPLQGRMGQPAANILQACVSEVRRLNGQTDG